MSLMAHRNCPVCNTPVGWQRFLLKSTAWARWPCPSCGTTLKFNMKRRILLALGNVLIGGVAALVGFFGGLLLPNWGVFIGVVFFLLCALPLWQQDGVVRT